MAAKASSPLVATRGSDGIQLHCGPPSYGEFKEWTKETSKQCRAMLFNKEGTIFVWCNGHFINAVTVPQCRNIFQVERPRVGMIHLSPKATILSAWEPYITKKDNTNTPNMHLWHMKTGKLLASFYQKRNTNWEMLWSDDEEISGRMVNNEVHFFQKNHLDRIVTKIHQLKVASFSISSGASPYHVACYTPGSKGQPSFVRLYKYPNFEGNTSTIANKSFFKADKVVYIWNKIGNGLLLMVSCDIDKSGASYYGEQTLHYIGTNGDTAIVKLPKDGPIYSVEWSPKCDQFCAVYGFMPAKATLFNTKCESIFDFGTGPRNEIYYNPRGTLLVLAGFGNLQGNVEVWDVKTFKQAGQMKASNTTSLSWAPDGEHILTATTAPRLRVGNGYRTWHYTGSLLMEKEWPENQELLEVIWQPMDIEQFPEKAIRYQPIDGIKASQPTPSIQVYRPPGARGQPSKFQIREEYEKPSNQKVPEGQEAAKASKNKKKKEAKKAKKEQEKLSEGPKEAATPAAAPNATINMQVTLSGDVEKDKKIRSILKKLDQIAKIKEQQKDGKQLEINQLDKINKETELVEELQQLQI